MPDLAVAVVVLIPASIVFAAGMAYWAGRTIERRQRPDSAQQAVDVIDGGERPVHAGPEG